MSSQSSDRNQYSYPQRFKLPKMEFSANDAELSALKKKLLANSYERQIHSKQPVQTQATAAGRRRKSENPEAHEQVEPTYIDLNMAHLQYERKMKTELAHQYQKQMEMKMALDRKERDRRRSEENKMIENLRQMNRIQQQRKRNGQLSYRQQIQEQVELAKLNKQRQMDLISKEKSQFRKRYGGNPDQEAPQQNSKLNKFKEHYAYVSQIQSRILKEYQQKWNPLIKEKEKEKQRFIEAGIAKAHSLQKAINIKNEEKEHRHKTELKQILQRQIKEKEEIRKSEMARNRSEGYVHNSLKSLHNPIYNPVDFKMAHDNKRILKELKQEKERDEKMSRLARNGSLVMMPFYPTQ